VPRYALPAVQEAARDGRVVGGGPRYRERLMPLLGEFTRLHDFACAVLLELQANDFIDSKRYENGLELDAYGLAISDDLQARFGLEGFVTWYVKFTLDRDDDGNQVVMASLHGAEQPLARVGGTLQVKFARRIS
jgi:hypothetical protein